MQWRKKHFQNYFPVFTATSILTSSLDYTFKAAKITCSNQGLSCCFLHKAHISNDNNVRSLSALSQTEGYRLRSHGRATSAKTWLELVQRMP